MDNARDVATDTAPGGVSFVLGVRVATGLCVRGLGCGSTAKRCLLHPDSHKPKLEAS